MKTKLLTTAVVAALALSVAVAHAGIGLDHGSVSGVVAMCLAIMGTTAALGWAAVRATELPRWSTAHVAVATPNPRPRESRSAFARDGPERLQVFLR